MSTKRFMLLFLAIIGLVGTLGLLFLLSGFNSPSSPSGGTFLYEEPVASPNSAQDRPN